MMGTHAAAADAALMVARKLSVTNLASLDVLARCRDVRPRPGEQNRGCQAGG